MARKVLLLAAALGALAADARATIIHCYLLDGNANDSVGTAHGTVKDYGGTGGWTTGRFGQAFDGRTSGFVSFPSTGILRTQGTFVQWVRIATTAGDWVNPLAMPIWDTQSGSQDPMRHEIHSNSIPRVYGVPNGASSSATIVTTTPPIRDGLWHQWVTTYDAATGIAILYVDGVRRGSAVYSSSDANLDGTWRLATRREDRSAGRCAGTYDNTAVYSSVLTPKEVNTLFYRSYDGARLTNVPSFSPGLRHLYPMATNANDTWDGYHGTVTGGSWVTDNPPRNSGGWRKTADANNVVLPMRVNLLEGTFEGWFKSSTAATDWSNPLATSIRATNEAEARDSMRLEVTASATYIFGSPGAGHVIANFDTTDDLWHHIAFTYKDGERVKLYIDGLLRGESQNPYDALLAYDRNLTILGSRIATEVTTWRGTVGTLAYFDFALSAADIAYHYQYGISDELSDVIPEPGSLSLLALGLFGCLLRRRR